ncbi:hypothetical protein GCM10027591_03210 [Zhihengliuella somnathii]
MNCSRQSARPPARPSSGSGRLTQQRSRRTNGYGASDPVAGLVPARFVKSREDPAVLVAGVRSRLVVVIPAGRALSPDDDAGVDEDVIAEAAMLDSVRVRARVAKGGGAVLLDFGGRMEVSDDQEGVDEPSVGTSVKR